MARGHAPRNALAARWQTPDLQDKVCGIVWRREESAAEHKLWSQRQLHTPTGRKTVPDGLQVASQLNVVRHVNCAIHSLPTCVAMPLAGRRKLTRNILSDSVMATPS